jgi:hypothetical protein
MVSILELESAGHALLPLLVEAIGSMMCALILLLAYLYLLSTTSRTRPGAASSRSPRRSLVLTPTATLGGSAARREKYTSEARPWTCC